jgi:hypothetical protein
MTKAKMLAIAFLEFLLGALLSGSEPIRLHSEDRDNPDDNEEPRQ